MNPLKRAVVTNIRCFKKSIILYFLITLIATSSLTGHVLSLSMNATEEQILNKVPAIALLQVDERNVETFPIIQPSLETMIAVAELPHVKAYDLTLRSFFYSRHLKWPDEMDPGVFTAIGVTNPNIIDIESGLIELLDGRVLTITEIEDSRPVVIIPERFAYKNNLSVGSLMEISNLAHDLTFVGDWSDRFKDGFLIAEQIIELEVVGIFKLPGNHDEESFFYEPMNFYMPFGIAEEIRRFEQESLLDFNSDNSIEMVQGMMANEYWLESLFLLENPRYLDEFIYESSLILPEPWYADGLDQSIFSPVLVSMDNVNNLADYIKYGVTFATATLLILLLLVFLKDRSNEIGIYRALGENKNKITFQIILEILIVSVFSLFTSILITSFFSEFLSNRLLEQHLIDEMLRPFNVMETIPQELFFHVPSLSVEQVLDLTTVNIEVISILRMIVTSLFLIISSILFSLWLFFRLKTKDLLT